MFLSLGKWKRGYHRTALTRISYKPQSHRAAVGPVLNCILKKILINFIAIHYVNVVSYKLWSWFCNLKHSFLKCWKHWYVPGKYHNIPNLVHLSHVVECVRINPCLHQFNQKTGESRTLTFSKTEHLRLLWWSETGILAPWTSVNPLKPLHQPYQF